MKVKFLDDYKGFNRGMQYESEAVSPDILAEATEKGIIKTFPQIEEVAPLSVKDEEVKTKPAAKSKKKQGDLDG